jgi:N-acetylmuramoyl-L-alanine amidase
VHLNSSKGSGLGPARGVETFILNNTSDESSKRLAELENKGLTVIGPETFSGEKGEVGLILKDLTLDGNLAESKRFACLVQSEVIRATSDAPGGFQQKNRGIKQALFYVLLGADMPSVLIEAGFLDHPMDRKLLSTPWGRNTIARGVSSAVIKFRKKEKVRDCHIEGQ